MGSPGASSANRGVTLRSIMGNDRIRMAVEIPVGLAEGVGDGKLVLVRPKQWQPAVYAFRINDHYRSCAEPKLGYQDFRMCQTVTARQNTEVLRAAGGTVSPSRCRVNRR